MKLGDIIICIEGKISEYGFDYLTLGNKYKVLDTGISKDIGSIPWVLVECEDGSKQHFSVKRFITLREYNLEKLV